MEDLNKKSDKTERRQHKKARRKFKLHGGSLRTTYPNVVRRKLKAKK